MAGSWIKMRADLQTHPKVVRISSALKADRLRAIGGLHAVWCLFDAHSIDGSLEGYTPEMLDSLIGCAGFTRAMESVGWLSVSPNSLSLPRFDDHNGQSAKRRADDSMRKRGVRNLSANEQDKKRTREEKRREEETSPSASPAKPDAEAVVPDTDVAEAAREYNVLAAEWAKPKVSARGLATLAPKLVKVRRAIQADIPEFTLAECMRRVRDQEEFFRGEWQGWSLEWFTGSKRGTYNAAKVWNRMYGRGSARPAKSRELPRFNA